MTDHLSSAPPDAAAADPVARVLACLDLTNLDDGCTAADVAALAARASSRHGTVAALCVWPRFAAEARAAAPPGVRVACVAAFPGGDGRDEDAVDEAESALAAGADEIDVVIPWRALLEGRPAMVRSRVERIKRAVGEVTVKAILETGMLPDAATTRAAAELAVEGGADFLKTSTGRVPIGATPAAARELLAVIAAAGRPVGFKASGGVRTVADAVAFLTLADEVMGAGWARPATFRIGASGLRDVLVAALDGQAATAPEGY